jgi:hypothetical protein
MKDPSANLLSVCPNEFIHIIVPFGFEFFLTDGATAISHFWVVRHRKNLQLWFAI